MSTTDKLSDNQKWNLAGREPYKFHPQASHVSPAYRDGWNDALDAVTKYATPQVERLTKRLNDEQEAHAALQARCFDSGLPTHGSIFDAVKELRTGHDRYEYVRRLSPHQFSVLWAHCLDHDVKFDDAVDAATAQAKQAEGGSV